MSKTTDEEAAGPVSGVTSDGLDVESASVGERLAAARQSQELTLQDIASKTRIPTRHLQAIEAGQFASLPGRTYAIGFGRAYARAVNLPEEAIAQGIREALGDPAAAHSREASRFDLDEPSKVPSARIAWLAAAVGAIILIAGFSIWRTYFFSGADVEELAQAADAESVAEPKPAPGVTRPGARRAAPVASAAVDPGAEVVFTATEDDIWIKFYDGQGKQLMQKQMALGEQYTVPADAVSPQVWTGRPDAFAITVGGRTVTPLGTSEVAVKDVPVTASALMARPAPTPPGTSAQPTPRTDAG